MMPNYRRNYQPGGTYFFTVVTHKRRRIFIDDATTELFRHAIRAVRHLRPFTIDAAVILPDHIHMVWTLPDRDAAFDKRWSAIKSRFTRDFLASHDFDTTYATVVTSKRNRSIWQPRYMEHTIRDEQDFNQHIDYIHFNPVKHGLAARPVDWPWSSLHRYIRAGVLCRDWGCGERLPQLSGVNERLLE